MNWRKQAACRDAPHEAFFPDNRVQAEETAQQFCLPCPVRAACREAADLWRDGGLRGGVLAQTEPGKRYERLVLLPGVELGVLPERPRTRVVGRRSAA